MRQTALAVVLVLVVGSMSVADGPEPPSTSVEALGQPLPTRAHHGGCTMSEEAQALFGNTPPPGTEIDPRSSEGRICEIELPICVYYENEGPCYDEYEDNFNAGCNHASEPFSVLPLSFGQPLRVRGTAGTYLFDSFSYRDTDWYEIVLDAPTEITMACIAEFPVIFGFIDGTSGCPVSTFIDYRTPDECVEDSLTLLLGPGTFWLFVAPADFTGVPCGSDYVMTLYGYQPPPCVLECPQGSVIEGEPLCNPDYDDFHNGGCNFDPQTFQQLDPSEGMIVLCGETGVYEYMGGCWRDLDWYEITPAEPSEIEFCAAAEFNISIILFRPGPDPENPCAGMIQVDWVLADACDAACINAVLDPGPWWLVVTTVDWLPLDCGSEYTMTLTGYTTPVEEVTWGSVKALYR